MLPILSFKCCFAATSRFYFVVEFQADVTIASWIRKGFVNLKYQNIKIITIGRIQAPRPNISSHRYSKGKLVPIHYTTSTVNLLPSPRTTSRTIGQMFSDTEAVPLDRAKGLLLVLNTAKGMSTLSQVNYQAVLLLKT